MFSPWKPPPRGWLKCYVDGAFDKSSQTGGVGVVIRDQYGALVGDAYLKLLHVGSQKLVKALANCAACELAIRFSLAPIPSSKISKT